MVSALAKNKSGTDPLHSFEILIEGLRVGLDGTWLYVLSTGAGTGRKKQ
jgi:hypothetical protein